VGIWEDMNTWTSAGMCSHQKRQKWQVCYSLSEQAIIQTSEVSPLQYQNRLWWKWFVEQVRSLNTELKIQHLHYLRLPRNVHYITIITGGRNYFKGGGQVEGRRINYGAEVFISLLFNQGNLDGAGCPEPIFHRWRSTTSQSLHKRCHISWNRSDSHSHCGSCQTASSMKYSSLFHWLTVSSSDAW